MKDWKLEQYDIILEKENGKYIKSQYVWTICWQEVYIKQDY